MVSLLQREKSLKPGSTGHTSSATHVVSKDLKNGAIKLYDENGNEFHVNKQWVKPYQKGVLEADKHDDIILDDEGEVMKFLIKNEDEIFTVPGDGVGIKTRGRHVFSNVKIRKFSKFDIEIRDKKGVENLADDLLSWLENPYLGKLTKAEIRDLFPEERLMAVSDNDNKQRISDSCSSSALTESYEARKVFEAGFYWPHIFCNAR
nr:retrovirus-related Pol polyprotein from transposon 17.6 [Tanacetum cinerariifolium]